RGRATRAVPARLRDALPRRSRVSEPHPRERGHEAPHVLERPDGKAKATVDHGLAGHAAYENSLTAERFHGNLAIAGGPDQDVVAALPSMTHAQPPDPRT